MHLADGFIQSYTSFRLYIFFSVHVFPGNRTHNLCAGNAMLYHWATGTHFTGTHISHSKRERSRSSACAEQEQCAPIGFSYWQRLSHAAEPRLVLQYRRVSSFLLYFPAFSSEHCVPCALMYDHSVMWPCPPLSHTHMQITYIIYR